MAKNLIVKQQIERDYHNNKYKTGSLLSSSTYKNSAYDFYQNLIDQFPTGRILDFGCGDGWVSINLAKNGHEVYGIDISIELIKKARNWAQELGVSDMSKFFEMTGENLSFNDNYFDAVVGSAVLHHTEFEMALDSIHRVLKPGAKGVFIEPMNENFILKIWRILTPWRRSPAEHALTQKEIKMIKSKFPSARLNFFIFTSILSNGLMTIFPRIHIFNKLNIVLEKFDLKLLKTFPKLGLSCAVVVIELIKNNDYDGFVKDATEYNR